MRWSNSERGFSCHGSNMTTPSPEPTTLSYPTVVVPRFPRAAPNLLCQQSRSGEGEQEEVLLWLPLSSQERGLGGEVSASQRPSRVETLCTRARRGPAPGVSS